MYIFTFIENNINMIFIKIALIILILFIIAINIYLNIKIYIKIENTNPIVKLNLRILFNLINFDINLYPRNKKSKEVKTNNKKKKPSKLKSKINKLDKKEIIKYLLATIKRIKIIQVYSNIHISCTSPEITILNYTFINSVYGFLFKFIDTKNIYLKVTPGFDKNYFYTNIETSLRFKIADMINIRYISKYIRKKIKSKSKKRKGD